MLSEQLWMALGKYVTVMCLAFKDDDRGLKRPENFGVLEPRVWLHVPNVTEIWLLEKLLLKQEKEARGPLTKTCITLSLSDLNFTFS